MRDTLPVFMQIILHVVMGALLGALAGVGIAMLEAYGSRSVFGALSDPGTFATIVLALTAWMGVGAGLSGFLLIHAGE